MAGSAEAIIGAVGLIPSPIDPALNEALSPSAGLAVSPLYFQSVEQEGRWKYKDWGFNHDRNLYGPITGIPDPLPDPLPSTPYPNPGSKLPEAVRLWSNYLKQSSPPQVSAAMPFFFQSCNLLTITIGAPQSIDATLRQAIARPLERLLGPTDGPNTQLISELLKSIEYGVEKPASVTIDANWLSDGTEIWAGYAGLQQATGFLSTFSHRVKIDIAGTVFGNYFPTAFLLGITGYVNPVGPVYIEFRCGVVISANANNKPTGLYASWWARDRIKGPQQLSSFTSDKGWLINFPTNTQYPT